MKPRHLLRLLLVGVPLPAAAHAILVESTPAINATAPAGHLALKLRYNSRIDAGRSHLALFGPDGRERALQIEAPVRPDMLTSVADLSAGSWRLRWQVLAIDGHITRGDIPFTLLAPGEDGLPKAAP